MNKRYIINNIAMGMFVLIVFIPTVLALRIFGYVFVFTDNSMYIVKNSSFKRFMKEQNTYYRFFEYYMFIEAHNVTDATYKKYKAFVRKEKFERKMNRLLK